MTPFATAAYLAEPAPPRLNRLDETLICLGVTVDYSYDGVGVVAEVRTGKVSLQGWGVDRDAARARVVELLDRYNLMRHLSSGLRWGAP